MHWDGFPEEVPGLPLPVCPLREQSSIMLNFVFQELPLWGGATGQLCLSTITAYVCKEARNTGFLDWILILFLSCKIGRAHV